LKTRKKELAKSIVICGVVVTIALAKTDNTRAEETDNNKGKEYDNTVSDLTTDKYLISMSEAIKNSYWEQTETSWIYHNSDGSIATGYFYDMYGDFYYAGPDGSVLINSEDQYGQFYGSDGRVTNYGYTGEDLESFKKKCADLESGKNVEFMKLTDLYDFIEYYGKEYRLGDQKIKFRTYRKRSTNKAGKVVSTKYFINNSDNTVYDRNAILTKMDELFGAELQGDTLIEKLEHACETASIIDYDDESITISLEDALDTSKGGCWHLCKIVNYMLTKNGIESELVTGKSYGIPHMWLRLKREDGSWLYCDPTFYINGLHEYLDIDYRIYKDNYRINRFFSS
jgi:hypothetical protein